MIIIIAVIAIIGIILFSGGSVEEHSHGTIGSTSAGTVEKIVYGNESAPTSIALITGMHPREKLAIDPEIQAAKEFSSNDVKIIHYKVTVTDSPEDYEVGRANGESLVNEFVNPDVTSSDADCVIISHSHVPEYGEGFYLATPEMDNASVDIAKKISENSDFNYYPVTGKNIFEFQSTQKTKELFDLMVRYA